jgi:magnesium chelatase subunit D
LALEILETERLKDRDTLPLMVLLSDGRANVSLDINSSPVGQANEEAKAFASLFQEKHISSVVVDTELGFIKLGLAQSIAESMGARYIKLDDLRADRLADAVRQQLPDGDQTELTPYEVQSMVRRLGLA